jgi:hypothetical protein
MMPKRNTDDQKKNGNNMKTEKEIIEGEKAMEELMNAIEGSTNIESLKFDAEKYAWRVKYKNGIKSDWVAPGLLIDFLKNA